MSEGEPIRRRINRLDDDAVRFILGRADSWVDGPDGLVVPARSYREIARLLKRSRGLDLHPLAIRRLVLREAPDLARRRGDCYELAVKSRKTTAA